MRILQSLIGIIVMECAFYNSIRDKFPSLFQILVLGSLTSFFQLDHQVDFSLYLTKGEFPCRLFAHHVLVGIRINVDGIRWGSVCMCQPTVPMTSG